MSRRTNFHWGKKETHSVQQPFQTLSIGLALSSLYSHSRYYIEPTKLKSRCWPTKMKEALPSGPHPKDVRLHFIINGLSL